MAYRVPAHLLKSFVDQGLVPEDCHALHVDITADGAILFRYEVYARPHHLEQFGLAFSHLAAAARDAQKT